MPYFRMRLPDGSVHREDELADRVAAHAWAQGERGRKSGMLGYLVEEWDGTAWQFVESSETHSGGPRYAFEAGPSQPPAGLDEESELDAEE